METQHGTRSPRASLWGLTHRRRMSQRRLDAFTRYAAEAETDSARANYEMMIGKERQILANIEAQIQAAGQRPA